MRSPKTPKYATQRTFVAVLRELVVSAEHFIAKYGVDNNASPNSALVAMLQNRVIYDKLISHVGILLKRKIDIGLIYFR